MSVPETGEFAWAMVGFGNAVIMFQETGSLQEEYPQLKGKFQNTSITFYVKLKGMNSLSVPHFWHLP
ncbi:hypothetical protein EZS27_043207 [termite gut metagenome]|uniref:Uncharacterized protein n=1 Tax=termite gut metagenome TaxID=433724 RepID=A0A5J4P9F1_9ZZZZ